MTFYIHLSNGEISAKALHLKKRNFSKTQNKSTRIDHSLNAYRFDAVDKSSFTHIDSSRTVLTMLLSSRSDRIISNRILLLTQYNKFCCGANVSYSGNTAAQTLGNSQFEQQRISESIILEPKVTF